MVDSKSLLCRSRRRANNAKRERGCSKLIDHVHAPHCIGRRLVYASYRRNMNLRYTITRISLHHKSKCPLSCRRCLPCSCLHLSSHGRISLLRLVDLNLSLSFLEINSIDICLLWLENHRHDRDLRQARYHRLRSLDFDCRSLACCIIRSVCGRKTSLPLERFD